MNERGYVRTGIRQKHVNALCTDGFGRAERTGVFRASVAEATMKVLAGPVSGGAVAGTRAPGALRAVVVAGSASGAAMTSGIGVFLMTGAGRLDRHANIGISVGNG